MMAGVWRLIAIMFMFAPAFAPPWANAAPANTSEMAHVELNAAVTDKGKCRLTFVIQNKTDQAIKSLKLDLMTFDSQGIAYKRIVTEMGPVRAAKTMVRIFLIDGECSHIGSVLVNDVTACAPADRAACLDGLTLSSRVKDVRLYK
jgi:hypothetical protein